MSTKEVLLVLGHRLEDDDTPSKILMDRLYAAYAMIEDAFYRAENHRSSLPPYDILLLSGGSPRPNQLRSEAAVMKQLMMELGREVLPRILCDEKSCNSLENLINGTKLLMEQNPDDDFKIEVVTHTWHKPRVLNYWYGSEDLREARQRCTLSIYRALQSHRLNGWALMAQTLGNVEAWFDPNRTLLNLVRPHAK